jgi:hypothetical protein
METYQLVVSVFLFLGLMGVVALLDRRRRTELAHFGEIQRALAACADALQAQASQTAGAVSAIRSAIEQSVKNSTDESSRAIKDAVNRMEIIVAQLQKAQDATGQALANNLASAATAASKELLSEAEKTTKAVRDLQASMEAAVKF